MSKTNQRKELKIPASHDVGVHFYYRNLLGGSDYVQAYIREYIALFDEPHAKLFDSVNAGEKIDSSERRQMPYEALVAVLEDAGVGEKILGQIKEHISHLAGGLGKPLDYLRVREFLSFCGIEGIFDLESKKHIWQERKVRRIPPTIVPERWRAAPNVEEIRQDIAFMMDNSKRVPALNAKIRELNTSVWGEFIVNVTKDVQNTPVPDDLEPLRIEYLAARPDLVPLNEELKGLIQARESTIEEMKNQYAPMNPDFKLPALGIEFDKAWYDHGEALINKQKPYRQVFDKYMAGLGHKKGDPEYDSFDWQNLRSRSFAIWDWTYRDYTASPVNRGVLADARKGDFDKGFVKAVKDELNDGLLGILNLPYKIELIEGTQDQYAIVCNDCVTESFTLQQVYDLETKVLEEADKAAKDPARKPRKPTVAPAAAPPAERAKKPLKSAAQKAEEKRLREDRLKNALIASGVDASEITVHDAQGVKTKVGETPAVDESLTSLDALKTPEGNVMQTDSTEALQGAPEDASGVSPVPPPTDTKAHDQAASESLVSPLPQQEEEELLFPGAGVAGEGGLDDNGNKIPDPISEQDDAAVNFGDVAPDRGVPLAAEAEKSADQPAAPKDSRGRSAMPPPPQTAPPNKVSHPDGARKPAAYPDRQRETGRAQQFDSRPNPQYTGGGGMGAMGGYGAQRGFSPQSVTVDMGLGHLMRSLTSVGRSIRDSLKSSGPNVFEATEAMNKSVADISATRTLLENGVDEAGAPLTEPVKTSSWEKLGGDIKVLGDQLDTLRKVPKGAMDDDTLKSFKNAAKEMNSAKELAKKTAESPGKAGEIAAEVAKLAEQMAKVLMDIVKTIMSVFSRNKSPSP